MKRYYAVFTLLALIVIAAFSKNHGLTATEQIPPDTVTAHTWGWGRITRLPVRVVSDDAPYGDSTIGLMQLEFEIPGSLENLTAFVNTSTKGALSSGGRHWKIGDEVLVTAVASKRGGGLAGSEASTTYIVINYRKPYAPATTPATAPTKTDEQK